ncbi:SGNH/GDSL hydrolase family protein [Paenibacillus senegalensis]|uniref:SGNH/GDSL hydrolase family protein n=1 Tax=Paenibacillus senegalensis TaxID=1465766 RepID=UPI0002887041|nr:SGNH/GDSL hydrolase family protein [Paenibacillus senegalensis]
MVKLKVEDGACTYTGSWVVQHTESASLHSRHDSDGEAETGASASWGGYIRGVEIYASKGADFGKADVYLDGILHGEIDYFSASEQHNVLVYTITGLAAGYHSISIHKQVARGRSSAAGRINLDYLLADFVHPNRDAIRNIVCIGDSITFGANVSPRPAQLYGRKLQQMLSIPVSIHGLSGASIRTITSIIDAVVVPRRPELILWLAGMNDSHPRADLERGIDRIQELLPTAGIIASTIQYNTYYTAEQNSAKVNEVRTACQNKGIPCVNLYAATFGNSYIHTPEGTVHPNGDGHNLIANLFYNEIITHLRRLS